MGSQVPPKELWVITSHVHSMHVSAQQTRPCPAQQHQLQRRRRGPPAHRHDGQRAAQVRHNSRGIKASRHRGALPDGGARFRVRVRRYPDPRTVMMGSALHRCGAFSSRRLRSCSASNTSLSWPAARVGEMVEKAFSR